jgi:hypothetical protein
LWHGLSLGFRLTKPNEMSYPTRFSKSQSNRQSSQSGGNSASGGGSGGGWSSGFNTNTQQQQQMNQMQQQQQQQQAMGQMKFEELDQQTKNKINETKFVEGNPRFLAIFNVFFHTIGIIIYDNLAPITIWEAPVCLFA